MKKILVGLALVIGFVGVVKAGGRAGGGWKAFTVSNSSAQIFSGHGFVNSMILSTSTPGDWAIGVDTVISNGVSYTSLLFSSASNLTNTQPITPALMFGSTTTLTSSGMPINNYWSAGQAADDYVEVFNGFWLFKSVAASGEGGKVTVYYSR